MDSTKELKAYVVTFATQVDIAAARKWVAERGNAVVGLLKEKDAELLSAWKHLFVLNADKRREAFLQLDETVRHLLLVRASELYTHNAADGRLPDLNELSHRFLVAIFERYTDAQSRKAKDDPD